MKLKSRVFIFIASLIIIVSACTNASESKKYQIDGKINAESGFVYLQKFRNKMFFTIDSTTIKDGTFSFSGDVEYPDLFGITLDKDVFPYLIFLENSHIVVDIDTINRRRASISGSRTNDLFVSYQQSDKRSFKIDSFIKANSTSIVSAYVLYRDYSYKLSKEEIQDNIQLLDSSLWDLPYVQTLKELTVTLDKLAIGKIALDFTTISPSGESIKLSDKLGKGYLLIDFWASWCAPCRRENPNIVNAYRKYKSKGFEILGISLDKSKDPWIEAIETDQLEWTHGSDLLFWDSQPARLYGVRAIPANYLIDAGGVIIAKNLRGEDLDKVLGEHLK
ncbi:Thiol-disulfide oxidoreductase ResA [termite gut metagenome]|uniref:Thiol-disulfide oxidoreductase ResA n=1 Tax=termite gut metagenome TaxID=433724 RepID=A0A5J4RAN4_9ZZZZ